MTYETSHFLIGGEVFSGGGGGGGQEKILLQKCEKNAKNYQTLKKFSSLLALTRHFTKFIFLEQLIAMPQFNMQNMFFSFCLLSSHHDTNPLLHLYHFRKKIIIIYWLILTVNHQGSYFLFFLSHPVGQTFLYPSKFCNHLKHSAK